MEPRVLLNDTKGEGEPLVLVPGGLTGWLSWIPHQERLADQFRVVRVQPIHNELGSAGQPGQPGYTAEVEREALRMTLDALELERVHLAGWSGGGKAALELAAEYPERVRTLTLVEPAAYWILEQLGEQDDVVEELNAFIHPSSGSRSPRTTWRPSSSMRGSWRTAPTLAPTPTGNAGSPIAWLCRGRVRSSIIRLARWTI